MEIVKFLKTQKYKITIIILILLVIICIFYYWQGTRNNNISVSLSNNKITEDFQSPTNLELWFPFTDDPANNNTTAIDNSGNSRNGTLIKGTSAKQSTFSSLTSSCRSVYLNGTDGHITTTYLPDITRAFTWSMWIYTTVSNVRRPLVTIGNNDSGWNRFEFVFEISSSNRLVVGQNGSFAHDYTTTTTSTILSNRWYHIALVYTPPNTTSVTGTFQFFIDSKFIYSRSASILADTEATTIPKRLIIGRYQYDAMYYFTGNITDFRVYNTAFVKTEIDNIYNSLALNANSGYQFTEQNISTSVPINVINAYVGKRTIKSVNGISTSVDEPAYAINDGTNLIVAINIGQNTYEYFYILASTNIPSPASVDFNNLVGYSPYTTKTYIITSTLPVTTTTTTLLETTTTTLPTTTTTLLETTTTTLPEITTTLPVTTTTTTLPETTTTLPTTTTTLPTTTTTTTLPEITTTTTLPVTTTTLPEITSYDSIYVSTQPETTTYELYPDIETTTTYYEPETTVYEQDKKYYETDKIPYTTTNNIVVGPDSDGDILAGLKYE